MVSGINADQLRSAVAQLAAGEPPVFARLPLSDGVTRNLAQTVADKNLGDYLKCRHWLRLTAACGLGAAPIIRRVRALATRVLARAGIILIDGSRTG